MDVIQQYEFARLRRAALIQEAETRSLVRQALAARGPHRRQPLRARAGQLFLAIGACLVGARAAMPHVNSGASATPGTRRPASDGAPLA